MKSSNIYLPTSEQYYYSFLEHGDEVIELISREDGNIKQYLIDEDGNRESVGVLEEWPENRKPWMPDIILSITNLYGAGDIERMVLCEVKTGPYAEFHGDQRDVMEILNRSPDRLVLQAKVLFDTEQDAVKIQFKKLNSTDLNDEVNWTAWEI